MRVEPDTIQSNILRSVDPAFCLFVFFRISDVAAFRSFLTLALDKRLTFTGTQTGIYSERDRLAHRRQSVESTATAVEASPQSHSLHMNVGFTLSGLEVLGVAEETCKSFPEPFREGMAARAAILGDDGISAPDRWEGYLGSKEVHGVLWWNWWDIRKQDRLPGDAHSKLASQADGTWDHIKEAIIRNQGIEIFIQRLARRITEDLLPGRLTGSSISDSETVLANHGSISGYRSQLICRIQPPAAGHRARMDSGRLLHLANLFSGIRTKMA